MQRRLALAAASAALLGLAASAPLRAADEPVDLALAQARAEARAAEAELSRLERASAKAGDEAARLAAERQAAAAAIVVAETRITAASAEARLAEAKVAAARRQLAERQAPLAGLLAGIVAIGRRPPLLGIADTASLDELVRVRALLDTSLPVIRRRTAALSAALADSRRLEDQAHGARARLAKERDRLRQRQQRFATLEAKAATRLTELGAGLVGASDTLVASSESEGRIRGESERRRAALNLAAGLAPLEPAPPRPGTGTPARPPLAYRLPAAAKVVEGVGAVSDTGIRARGLTLETYRGQALVVPADGTIAFAGPFRGHDGIVIIDHGRGWMTLMTGVRTRLRKGERVRLGDPLGRTLGPVTVELSTDGRPVSAALIAGSARSLSIHTNNG